MRGRGAGAAGVVLLLLAGLAPTSFGATTVGALTVTAPDWQVIGLPGNESVGRTLFQTPGDLNGDGFDDLVAWRGVNGSEMGFVLYNGSPSGLDLAKPSTAPAGPGVPGSFHDTGNPASWDSRPTGIDLNVDGMADLAGASDAGLACSEGPRSAWCLEGHYEGVALGSPTRPLNQSSGVFSPDPISGVTPRHEAVYLLGPVRPGSSAAVLGERVTSRDQAPGGVAFTTFTLVEFTLSGGLERTWEVQEPLPLANFARPPRFVAAPDFDGDGLSDIVTWSPWASSAVPPLCCVIIPGRLMVYNGTAAGVDAKAPTEIRVDVPQFLLADLRGDGHTDLVTYSISGPAQGAAGGPVLVVSVFPWAAGRLQDRPVWNFTLQGPSIFPGQVPVRLQAGDIDGDGRVDLASLKYDTTSSSSGHLLVDVFLNPLVCGDGDPVPPTCDADPQSTPSFSTEIVFNGADIYAGDGGLRLNVQADYDGDGRADITVGYYGGNAPERGRTSTSGFVAVLYASTVLREFYGVWIDTDPGLTVFPAYRNYTVTGSVLTTLESDVFRVNLTGLPDSPYLEVGKGSGFARSSNDSILKIDGKVSFFHGDALSGALWMFMIPVRFNWSFPAGIFFGLEAGWLDGLASERAVNPRAGRLLAGTAIEGDVRIEWAGVPVPSGAWVTADALVNVSNLTLEFAGRSGFEVPPSAYEWRLLDGSGAVLTVGAGGWFQANLTTPSVTSREVRYAVTIAGDAARGGAPQLNFSLNVDADPPGFGAHLPLESEWVTSTPTFTAVDIFDNESGVDPDRIEYSWENDGAPFVRWDRAAALPGQTAAEVVGQTLILFPEGNLSNVIWRAWDRVGNGPAQSPIFGVKVDTTGITFRNARPQAAEWQNRQSVVANVEILSGSSGVYRDSVEYRVSTGGLFAFGPWTAAPTLSSPLDPAFVATTALSLEEGDSNWVQWRADSNSRLGLRLSDPFQIRVDSLRPIIDLVQPNESSIFPLGHVQVSVWAHEGSPQAVAQRGLDTSAGAATYRVKGPEDLDYGPIAPLSLFESSAGGWSASFGATRPFERGNSTVEFTVRENGGRAVTAFTTVRVNRLPTVTIQSSPPNFTVAVLANLTLTATATDPEGQPLRYGWSSCTPPPASPPTRPPSPPTRPPPPFSTNTSITLSPDAAEGLRTTTARAVDLCLFVRDSMDGEVRMNMTVQVVVPPPPEPAPTAPQVTVPTADAGLAAVILVVAAAVAALALLLRRRRAPPDNV